MKPDWGRFFLCAGCFLIPAEKDHDEDEDLALEPCAVCRRPSTRAVLAPPDAEQRERPRKNAESEVDGVAGLD